MRILIILSTDAGAQAAGVLEFDGLIEAYYLFRDAGADVVVAAPGGGSASESLATAPFPAMQRFKSDRGARDALNDLVDLASVCAGDFDGAICLGAQSDAADLLIARLLAAAKPVALIAPPRLAANALLGAIRGR
jgi:putative intracellular protease/amidase